MAPLILNAAREGDVRRKRTLLLQAAGFEVMEAETGAEILKLVQTRTPDVAILEVSDAAELCNWFRSGSETARTAVIQITSTGDSHRSSAADAVLTGPVDSAVLVALARAHARARAAETEAARLRSALGEDRQARETAELESRLLAAVGQAVIATDAAGIVQYWGAAAERIYGWRADEAAGRSIMDLTVPELSAEEAERIMQDLRRGESWSGTFRVRRKSGEVFWAEVTDTPVMDGRGQLAAIVGVSFDITSRVETESALRESERRLSLAQRAGGAGVFDWDLDTGRVVWTAELEGLFGLPPGGFGGSFDDWARLVHPEDLERLKPFFTEWIASGRDEEHWTYRFRHGRGDLRWMETRCRLIRDAGGTPARMIGSSVDITSRKIAEQELAGSEARFRAMFQANPIGMLQGDVFGNIRLANDAFLAIVGYSREDLESGLRWTDLTPPEFLERDHQGIEEAREKGVCTPYEKEYIRKDGSRVSVVVGFALIGAERDQSVAFILDITGKKRAERALEESEQRHRLVLRAANDVIWDWDVASGELSWHGAIEDVLGYTADSIKPGREFWTSSVYPDDRARVVRAFDRLLAGGADRWTGEYRFRRADGTLAWVLDRAFVLRDDRGKPLRVVGSMLDVTRLRKAEEDLRDLNDALARSNEDLQRFAYAASHDLQEPLRAVSSFAGLLARRLQDRLDEDERDFVNYILSGTERMRQLIQALLDYSRVGHDERDAVPTDTNAILQWGIMNLGKTIEESGAEVTHERLPAVLANELLVQVFQNLIGNAIKYRGADRKPQIHISAFTDTLGYCQFSVSDNGIGFDMAHRDRIFQVFRRLHPASQYKGTGIGLAITKKIIERFGGRIWAESTPGEGSTFRFTLPAADVG